MNKHIISWAVSLLLTAGVVVAVHAESSVAEADGAAEEQQSSAGAPATSDAPETADSATSSAKEALHGSGGMVVYKHPTTGRLSPLPPGKDEAFFEQNPLGTDSHKAEGLTEVVHPDSKYGVSIHLQGRFRNAMTYRVSEGRVHSECAVDHGSISAMDGELTTAEEH